MKYSEIIRVSKKTLTAAEAFSAAIFALAAVRAARTADQTSSAAQTAAVDKYACHESASV